MLFGEGGEELVMMVRVYGYGRAAVAGMDKIRRFCGDELVASDLDYVDNDSGTTEPREWITVRFGTTYYNVHRKQCRVVEHIRNEKEL